MADESEPNVDQGGHAPFVIALGASAGGLTALSSFCAALAEGIDAALVVMPHLAPEQPSGMVRLLARQTDLPVRAMKDGQTLERGNIYVLVPGRLARLEGGRLRLRIDHGGPLSMPIDRFLISMAADCGRRCAAVILSGTGSDGVRGIRAVHRSGGMVLVQSPADARFDGMPRSAIASGVADMVGTAGELAIRLQETSEQEADSPTLSSVSETLAQTLADRLTPGGPVDFHRFEPFVFSEGLRARMAATHIATVEAYLDLLESRPIELDALRMALLARHDRFFDDPTFFDALTTRVLPSLLSSLGRRTELRIWCIGCGTGELAYSLGMVVLEAFEARGIRGVEPRIFATDVDEAALGFAQDAQYPITTVEELGEMRVDRHMVAEGENLRIRRSLRRHVIFARHDVLRDAPFARLDMVICRGLISRLRRPMRQRLMARLHFSLREDGLLVLGDGDGLEPGEFDLVDSRARMFRRRRSGVSGEGKNARFREDRGNLHDLPREVLAARLEASELANEQLQALNAELQASLAELRGANAGLQVDHERLALLAQSFERTIQGEQRLTGLMGHVLAERGVGATVIDHRGVIRWVTAPATSGELPLWAGVRIDELDEVRLSQALATLVRAPEAEDVREVAVGADRLRLRARPELAVEDGEILITIEHLSTDGD